LPCPFQVAVFDEQELLGADLVAAPLIGAFHCLARNRIDELVPEAMAGAPVHLPER
jgi:hypothetical protein